MLSWHAPEGLGEAHVGSALPAEQPQDGDDESDESEEEEVSSRTMRWTMRRMRSRSCCCQRLPLPRGREAEARAARAAEASVARHFILAPTAEAVAESGPSPLREGQQEGEELRD